jgi:hypothetical protein
MIDDVAITCKRLFSVMPALAGIQKTFVITGFPRSPE